MPFLSIPCLLACEARILGRGCSDICVRHCATILRGMGSELVPRRDAQALVPIFALDCGTFARLPAWHLEAWCWSRCLDYGVVGRAALPDRRVTWSSYRRLGSPSFLHVLGAFVILAF